MSLQVVQPGILGLLQDGGRRGQHRLGLTNGGPMDREAFLHCNRLLGNAPDSTVLEISFGGVRLQAKVQTYICVTGATLPLSINGKACPLWEVLPIVPGDQIHLDYAEQGCRAYLGVAEGFSVTPRFGSTATVMREAIGGLNGNKIAPGDELPCPEIKTRRRFFLPSQYQPRYGSEITVRVIPGYQQRHFSRLQQRRFFSSPYTVTDRSDRMGYRLEGPSIECDIDGILSEGICAGAVQIPADGQPIVLLNDRQTIGGYPKIGSAISLDTDRLAQLTTGAIVHFAPISPHAAHNALHLANSIGRRIPMMERRQ